jgi:membrane protein DedA with SNARE-associated domain
MDANHLVATFGYWAVLLSVTIGCAGVPFPAAAIFVAAAIYAGSTHALNIYGVISVAAVGAIAGTMIGYWLGKTGGLRIVDRYGDRLHLTQDRLQLGEYLFMRYGGRTILFGRFVSPLRTFSGFLAGLNHMPWNKFVLPTIIGSILWACIWGGFSYIVGDNNHNLTFPGSSIILAVLIITAVYYLRRFLKRLSAEAKAAFSDQSSTPSREEGDSSQA